MFYSETLLGKQGRLANVWLAASLERKLSRPQFLKADIPDSVDYIIRAEEGPLSLRLTGQLLLGVTKIYSHKAKFLEADCVNAYARLKDAFRPGNLDLRPAVEATRTAAVAALEAGEQGPNAPGATSNMLQNTVTDFDSLQLLPDLPMDLGGEQFSQRAVLPLGERSVNLTSSQLSSFEGLSQKRTRARAEDITLQSALDRSIEVGRGGQGGLADEEDDDLHLDGELDLNLGLDDSLELGRGPMLDFDLMGGDQGGADDFDDLVAPMIVDDDGAEDIVFNPSTPDADADILGNTVNVADVELDDEIVVEEPQVKKIRPNSRRARLDAETEQPTQRGGRPSQSERPQRHELLPRDSIAYGMLSLSDNPSRLAESIWNPQGLTSSISQLTDPLFVRDLLKRKRGLPTNQIAVNEDDLHFDASMGGAEDFDVPASKSLRIDDDDAGAEDMPSFNFEPLDPLPQFVEDDEPVDLVNDPAKLLGAVASDVRDAMVNDTVSFSALSAGKPKAKAVTEFFNLLVLATKDAVSLQQDRGHGDIVVTAKQSLASYVAT